MRAGKATFAALLAMVVAMPTPARADDPDEAPLATAVSLDMHLAFLLGEPATFNPSVGYGIRLAAAQQVLGWRDIALSIGGELVHDRFTRPEWAQVPVPGTMQTALIPDAEQLYETSAGGFARLTFARYRLRPYLQVGAGLSWAFFHSPTITGQGDVQTLAPFGRLDLGLDLAIKRNFSIRLYGEATRYLSSDTVTVSMRPEPIFGDIADLGIGMDYRF